MDSRSQLLKSYGVPKINETLVEQDVFITRIHEEIVKITMESNMSEFSLNAKLLQFYAMYDVQKKGYIASNEFELLFITFMNALKIQYEKKSPKQLAKIMDVNQDGSYSKNEIVRNYTKEEIKEYFETKR